MNTRITNAFWSAAIGVAALGCIGGCEDKRRHQPSDGVIASTQPALAPDAAPADVVHAFIEAIQEAQRIRAGGLGGKESKEAYDQAMAKIAGLAARSHIHKGLLSMKSPGLPANLTEAAAITMISESWVSMAAYYTDGFMYETLLVYPAPPAQNAVVKATIEAVCPRDEARMAEIEQALFANPPTDAEGNPITRDSESYLHLLREKALSEVPPFNIPVRVRFSIQLFQATDGWRVSAFAMVPVTPQPQRLLPPADQPMRPLAPPSQPSTSPTSPATMPAAISPPT